MVGIDSAYSVISNSRDENTSMTKYERALYDAATFSNLGKNIIDILSQSNAALQI